MTRYFIATDSYISKIIDVDSLDTAKLIAKAILKKTTKRDRKQSLWPCCNIYSVDELDRNPDSARLTEIIISVPPIKPNVSLNILGKRSKMKMVDLKRDVTNVI